MGFLILAGCFGNARTGKFCAYTTALVVGLIAAIGCTSGLGKGSSQGGQSTIASENVVQGFDLGGSTRQPIADVAVAGGTIPPVADAGTQELLFVAFASSTDRSAIAATTNSGSFTMQGVIDGNGSSDIFLAVVSKAIRGGQPTAFNQAIVDTFHHPRCISCHGFRSPTQPTFNSFGSSGNGAHLGGPDSNCSDCHNSSTVGLDPSGVPVVWEAPDDLDFRRPDGTKKGAAELVAMLEAFEIAEGITASEHLKHDDKIIWAIDRGTVPQDGKLADEGDVPIDLDTWLAQIDAWEAGGRQVTTADAIQDIAIVNLTGAVAAGGASSPSITYVPNPSFDPNNPTATHAGTVFVAYVSDEQDLPPTTLAPTANVFRSTARVRIDNNGAASLDVVTVQLASAVDGMAFADGNADSASPSISRDGRYVAFESLASNLITFTDLNGADRPDIFRRDVDAALTTLVSRSSATGGGNLGSFRPSIAPDSNSVAFESDATNFVAGDDNGQRDIYLTTSLDTTPIVQHISRRIDGLSATGGDCRHASIHTDGTTTRVAFESDKTDLTGDPRSTGTDIVLYERNGTASPTLRIVSRPLRPGVNGAANGSSFGPKFSPNGNAIYFETLASNLDGTRTTDANAATDVVRADISNLPQRIGIERISITATGADSDGDSAAVTVGRFERADGGTAPEFAIFSTTATNLGTPESTGLVISLVDPNSNPMPQFTRSPDRPVGLTFEDFTFDATGSIDPDDDPIVSYEWSFGDGNTATGAVVTHAYSLPASREIVLTTTDSRGAIASTSFSLQLIPLNTAPFSIPGSYAPVPALSPITFDGSGSIENDVGDEIVSYAWDFGDGTTGAGESVDHTYSAPGTYTVTLTVTDYFGEFDVNTTTVDVVEADPSFSGVYVDIIEPRCGGCHDTGDPYFDASFANASDAYAGIRFGDSSAGCYSGIDYVIPGDPNNSLFIIKVDTSLLSGFGGGCGTSSLMPSPGNPLSAAEILRLKLWVTNGAAND